MVAQNFDFYRKVQVPRMGSQSVHVEVRGLTVKLYDGLGKRIATGVWDAGGYMRFAQSQLLAIHPAVLDDIDHELRRRIHLKGHQQRVDPPRASAVGYGDR